MTISRKLIRQGAAARIGAVIVGTATSGEDKSLTTTHYKLLDDGAPDEGYRGWFLLLRPGDVTPTPVEETRVVDHVETSEGKIIHKGAVWSNDPASSDEFELHRYEPELWNKAINLTMNKVFRAARETITGVASQLEYALAAYTWITSAGRIKNVYARVGDTALQYHYDPLAAGSHWWRVNEDEGVFTLEISPAIGTSDSLVIEGDKPYDELSTDAATTAMPDALAIAGAIYHLYHLLSLDEAHDASSQSNAYSAKAMAALPEYSRLLKLHKPQVGGQKMQFPRPYSGPTPLLTSR